ncbi:methionyl-tRNA synthetase [Grosmannia clavigera kw1407]|uniref:Probable methionine--tRNA ligase, mitochondrial n=1 Tax=Grosmannia clavigera (strain kw1407 / UAMH 11150) TaxID=655863 RepID=F0XEB9_GROCL|nr:methionyl-tRNA synthetase [Grosmannia clavigera kw1407]EFX04667.1 methionyl-tRNA synthetase [Grosmannia clavigera kw1407]
MNRIVAARRLGILMWPAVRLPGCSCSGFRRFQSFQRLQSDVSATKPYYVTTPIFYVNSDPHVGHMYSMVLADVLKRWQTLQGRRALLCTGTDEHGMKVQQAATRAGVAPKQFCDENAAVFADLARRAQLANDFFIRTTDSDHVAAVRAIWRRLRRRGYVYQTKHQGWYCVSDETFYPEALVEKRIAAATGRVEMVSTETGKTVEWTEEINYHFRMTAVRDRLLQLYAARPDFVVPAARMAEVVHWVTNQLEDLSISRPASRLTWGVAVPEDASQTIYVWVDALVNYLTKAGYPDRWEGGEEGDADQGQVRAVASSNSSSYPQAVSSSSVPTPEQRQRQEAGGWPADVQVMGKDIVRFHAVYWPALLLALDLPVPRQLLSHAHWTLGRKKMSKSDGNVVNPFYAMDRFGVDAMRYYLVYDGGVEQDADYGNEHIVERYKKGLQGGLGNLLGRIMRTTRWNVREAVEEATAAGKAGMAAPEPSLETQASAIDGIAAVAAGHMDRLDARGALRAVMGLVYQTNRFVHENAPWTLARTADVADEAGAVDVAAADRLRMRQVVFLAAEALRVVSILLQPVMPAKAAEVLDVLGVASGRRTFQDARLGADTDYGLPLRSPGKSSDDGLFPPLPVED